ncbi:MAG: lipopolysaccharide biosynthesis protein [Cyanobacteria bacterium J06636_16]
MLHFLRNKNKINPEQFFATDHLQADLKGRSVRGGIFTLVSQVGRFLLQILSTTLLARILSPQDYGLVGMTTVITGFIQIFKDIGLAHATIQRPEINHKQVSTLFWVNFAVGIGLALITVLAGPGIAWFYSEPKVAGIMYVLSLNFILSGMGAQHAALLKRQMRFLVLAKITLLSMTVGVIAAVVTGLLGGGYWALVVLLIGNTATTTLSVWMICGWRPGWPSRASGVGEMLRFGGNLTGFNTVNYFSRNLDNILIGRVWGAQALGLYAKSYSLLLLPISQINFPITSVALPVLSRLQTEPERYKRYYFKAIAAITTISMPIVGFLFAGADQLILLILGEQWIDAVPIFRLLAPAAMAGTFNVAIGWAYNSLGRTDQHLKGGIITSIMYTLVFAISVRWGTTAVAAAYGVASPLIFIFALLYCYSTTFLQPIDFGKAIYRQLLASVTASLVIWRASYYLTTNFRLVETLIIEAIAFTGIYVLIWAIMPNGYRDLFDIFSSFKELRSKK